MAKPAAARQLSGFHQIVYLKPIKTRDAREIKVRKEIRLNAFDMNCVGHLSPGLWTHPRDHSENYLDLNYWIDLAKILERGKFDGKVRGSLSFSQNPEQQPKRYLHSIRQMGGVIPCSNPVCRRGGFAIDGVLLAMRQSGEIEREGSVPCGGDEGSPKGQRRGSCCGNRVRYRLTVKYKTK